MSNARPKRYVVRLSHYLRRYGSAAYEFKWPIDKLTPKQRRRLFHKAGRHDRLVEEANRIAEETRRGRLYGK